MAIDVNLIKKIREETAAGVADIKNALEEANGDEAKAKELLKKKGFERADKKSEREIKAGKVFAYLHHNGTTGAMITLGCETDFVAKTDEFQKLGAEIAMQVASMNPESLEEALKQDYIRDSSKTIETLIKEVVARTGENCQLLDFKRFSI
jgi:elongation factor Ts